jgi:hypothetical protein
MNDFVFSRMKHHISFYMVVFMVIFGVFMSLPISTVTANPSIIDDLWVDRVGGFLVKKQL